MSVEYRICENFSYTSILEYFGQQSFSLSFYPEILSTVKFKSYGVICLFLLYSHVFVHFFHLFTYSIYIPMAIPSPFHLTQPLISDSFYLPRVGGYHLSISEL